MSIKSLLKKNRLVYRAANAARKLPYPLLTGLCHIFRRLFGINGRSVFFCCFDGALYNDNPRYVSEALHRMDPDARLFFCLSPQGMKQQDLPQYIIPVPCFSLRALRAMSCSRVIVKNAAMRPWMRKFPGQFYVQTWHGDRGFKKIRLDCNPDEPSYIREGGWMDLAVSGSAFGTRVYRSAMRVQGEIMQCGCPRNDLLLSRPTDVTARVRKALGIRSDQRVLLYAPTFRNGDTGKTQASDLRLERIREVLERSTQEPWVCLTRGHTLVDSIRSDAAMDVTQWTETGELLLITDILITDYSSIGGDFMLLERPVIYYQPDIEAYTGERGLYFDPADSPLMVAHTESELLDILSHPIDGPENCRAVLDFFGTKETGNAAQAVAAWIAERLKPVGAQKASGEYKEIHGPITYIR